MKESKFTTRREEAEQFEFIAEVNDDNSVPEDILNELELHLKRYEPSKNIHYHLYDNTMFFGATKEHGIFLCIYCEASKMPLHLVEINGIRCQDYKQIIGESLNPEKHSAKKVYI